MSGRGLLGGIDAARSWSVAHGRPCEVGSAIPSKDASSWVAEVVGTEPRPWRVRVAGTFRRIGAQLVAVNAPKVDRASAPVRVWLEARAGAVAVMVASKKGSARARLDGIREVAVSAMFETRGQNA